MNDRIIGREKEIKIFNKKLNSNRAEFLALYGRRRVGKTFLIREYFKPHIEFAFSGSFEEETDIQLENFFSEYLERTGGKKETTPPANWSKAFTYLAKYLQKFQRRQKKVVVFIDELPWLDRPKSGFVKALEYFWNQHVSAIDNVLLIVCGSAASWMQKKLFKAKGGLYNRVTQRIKLMPFTLHETELFCKERKLKLSKYQIVQLYMVMGGIPFYLNELTNGKSAIQLIDELCFTSTGLLSNEYEQLYYSLFKNADNHISVVETLAKHPYGLTRFELIEKSKLPDGGTFTRTVEDLAESGFIIKYRPFNKKNKDSIYRLIDLYSLFYLRFIKNNTKDLQHTWRKISGQSSFVAWSGYAYENICMQHVRQILVKLGLSGTFTETSSWWYKGDGEIPGAQIDMLIDRKDGVINLCEAKFTQNEYILTKADVENLRRKRSIFSHITKTKKTVVTTLLTTFPALRNQHFFEEIHSEVIFEDLFVE